MAAIRLGFAVANPIITKAIRAVKSPYNVNSVTQEIGAAVLSHGDKLKEATTQIIESRKTLYTELTAIEALYPDKIKSFESCTNFVLLRLQDAKGIFQELLQDGIAIRFMGSYVRVTAGSEEENRTFIKQFKEKCDLRWGR
jgi:histidinol-phosphate aminotransferase